MAVMSDAKLSNDDRCAPDGDTSASPGTRTTPHPDRTLPQADGEFDFYHNCEPSLRRRVELDALAAGMGHNVRVEDITLEWWHRRCVVVEIGDWTLDYTRELVFKPWKTIERIRVVKDWKTSERIGVGADAIAAMDDACDWLMARHS
jgi:hypothetical protein